MTTMQELQALVELAMRAPKSHAESLWLADFVRRINDQAARHNEPTQDTEAPGRR